MVSTENIKQKLEQADKIQTQIEPTPLTYALQSLAEISYKSAFLTYSS